MKIIKICPVNSAAIQLALSAVNTGRGFATYADIQKLAVAGERVLAQLDLPPRGRTGATYVAISGKSNAYGTAGTCTRVTLRRRTADWYLDTSPAESHRSTRTPPFSALDAHT